MVSDPREALTQAVDGVFDWRMANQHPPDLAAKLEAHIAAAGYAVVPVEPTEAMLGALHDAYEAAAVEYGWNTQTSCRAVAWPDLPEANRQTMRAAVRAMLSAATARDGQNGEAGA